MKILSAIGPAGHEGNKVRVLPNGSALSLVGSIILDPLLQIKVLKMGKHRTPFVLRQEYRTSRERKSRRRLLSN